MDFSSFDRRGYPGVSVEEGYADWANDYDATVTAGLDQPLLDALNVRKLAADAARSGPGLRSRPHRYVAQKSWRGEHPSMAST